jgi:hypothetical protein
VPAQSWQPPPEPKPPRPVPGVRRKRLNKEDRERVTEAAEFCADVLAGRLGQPDGSWQEAWRDQVADRLSDKAGDAWQRLTRGSHHRRRRYCRRLARMARTILKAKDRLHDLAAELAGNALSVAGVRGPALDFTKELVRHIHIPVLDTKMIAAARTIQMAGIVLCLMDDRDLTRCQCFIDLALAETKERASQILEAALGNLTRLAEYGPAPVVAVSPASAP